MKDYKVETKDFELLTELRNNIYMFSAAKTFREVKEMTAALINDNGTVRSFSKFKKEASKIFDEHNVQYLKTEYNTAIGQALNASKWSTI